MKIKVFDIEYDVDSPEDLTNLPRTLMFEVEDWLNDLEIQSELEDMVSNETGFCVHGLKFEHVKDDDE